MPVPRCTACPLGTLDSDPGVRPQKRVFVDGKAPWYEITDDLPQHRELG